MTKARYYPNISLPIICAKYSRFSFILPFTEENINYISAKYPYRETLDSSWSKSACIVRTCNERESISPYWPFSTIKGVQILIRLAIMSGFSLGLHRHTLRSCSPGLLNYGMFAFLKIKLLSVRIAHRDSPRATLNKFTSNWRTCHNSRS